MMKKSKITVMVTGVGGGGHGEQIFKALRMADTDYDIIGCDMSKNSIGLAGADHAYIVPPANSPEYMDKILEICAKHGVKALFHGSEPELKIMAQNREKIEKKGIFLPINPSPVIDICMDKFKTISFLKDNGFDYLRTLEITKSQDIEAIPFLPAILKPSVGGGGSSNVFLAQTREELKMFSEYLLRQYSRFIVQEYIGTVDAEYTVGVLFSMDGELLNSIAVKKYIMSGLSNRIKVKNISNRKDFGEILAVSSGVSQGEIGRFPEVSKVCEKIAQKLGCRGAVNIQCRLFNGKVYVFEINPRFSGTTSLRAMVRYNEPDVLIRKHLLGMTIESFFEYDSGVIMRGLKEILIK